MKIVELKQLLELHYESRKKEDNAAMAVEAASKFRNDATASVLASREKLISLLFEQTPAGTTTHNFIINLSDKETVHITFTKMPVVIDSSITLFRYKVSKYGFGEQLDK